MITASLGNTSITATLSGAFDRSTIIDFIFESGDDESGICTITARNAGTYTASTQDGSSGTITYNINSGGFSSFVNPTTLAIGDTIQAKRTITTSDGFASISGTLE